MNPQLPLEIREQIWEEFATLNNGQGPSTDGLCHVKLESSGYNEILRSGLAAIPALFREFLHATRRVVIFAMPSREAFRNFSELVGAHYGFDPSLVPRLQVEIKLFSTKDMEGAMSLGAWKDIDTPHGYREKAYEHVREWMNVVQKLSTALHIHIIMLQPWRDFRQLRGVTRPLRDFDHRLEVHVREESWDGFPDTQFLIRVAIASFAGIKLVRPSDLEEFQVKKLIRLGCRGF